MPFFQQMNVLLICLTVFGLVTIVMNFAQKPKVKEWLAKFDDKEKKKKDKHDRKMFEERQKAFKDLMDKMQRLETLKEQHQVYVNRISSTLNVQF